MVFAHSAPSQRYFKSRRATCCMRITPSPPSLSFPVTPLYVFPAAPHQYPPAVDELNARCPPLKNPSTPLQIFWTRGGGGEIEVCLLLPTLPFQPLKPPSISESRAGATECRTDHPLDVLYCQWTGFLSGQRYAAASARLEDDINMFTSGLQILPEWQDYFHHPQGKVLGVIQCAHSLGNLAVSSLPVCIRRSILRLFM
jgi:hypothetical protein